MLCENKVSTEKSVNLKVLNKILKHNDKQIIWYLPPPDVSCVCMCIGMSGYFSRIAPTSSLKG